MSSSMKWEHCLWLLNLPSKQKNSLLSAEYTFVIRWDWEPFSEMAELGNHTLSSRREKWVEVSSRMTLVLRWTWKDVIVTSGCQLDSPQCNSDHLSRGGKGENTFSSAQEKYHPTITGRRFPANTRHPPGVQILRRLVQDQICMSARRANQVQYGCLTTTPLGRRDAVQYLNIWLGDFLDVCAFNT